MISGVLAALGGSPLARRALALGGSTLARRALALGAAALAVLLFTLSLRRAGERAGRAAERLHRMEIAHDVQRRMLDAAARRPGSRDALARLLRAGRF